MKTLKKIYDIICSISFVAFLIAFIVGCVAMYKNNLELASTCMKVIVFTLPLPIFKTFDKELKKKGGNPYDHYR